MTPTRLTSTDGRLSTIHIPYYSHFFSISKERKKDRGTPQ